MSQIHALTDDQVSSELKKMTAFIRQEALEKAREIQLKADEEFAIEKSKLVRSETAAIDAQYASKYKTASMSRQITLSTLANKTRLRVLGARQDLLDDLFDRARGRLGDFSKGDYSEVLRGLLLEGLYAMNESKIAVQARKRDTDGVKKAIEGAKKEYKENMGRETDVVIDEKNPLADESTGGIMVLGTGGKITLNNTLEERLNLLSVDALPQLRLTLFGENTNRKFTT
ncbi:MAG: hypothetical protein Q9162_005836 [Coniocarpon cinnabarinum]